MSPPEMCAHIRLISESEDRGDRVSHGPSVYHSHCAIPELCKGTCHRYGVWHESPRPQIHRFWSEAPAPRCLWNAAISQSTESR